MRRLPNEVRLGDVVITREYGGRDAAIAMAMAVPGGAYAAAIMRAWTIEDAQAWLEAASLSFEPAMHD